MQTEPMRNRSKPEKEVHTGEKLTKKDNFSSLGIDIQYTLLFTLCQLAFFLLCR